MPRTRPSADIPRFGRERPRQDPRVPDLILAITALAVPVAGALNLLATAA